MNGIPSLYQMTPTGVPFRTGIRGEPTSEQRYFVPGFSTAPVIPLTPEQQADLALAAQRRNYDSGGGDSSTPTSPGPTSSPTMGSSGGLGGIAQSLGGAVASMQNTFGPFASAIPGYGLMNAASNIGQDLAIDANAKADAALAKANEQANYAKVTSPYFSFGPQVTTAVDIAPVPGSLPGTQQVSPIAPDVVAPGIPVTDLDVNVDPTAALTQMNQQQAEEDETSPVDVAMDVAATVAATQDAVDAEAGQTVGAPPGTTADQGGGGGGGGGGEGVTGGYSTEATIGVDANDAPGGSAPSEGTDGASPSFQYGGRVMNYAEGGETSGRYQYTYNPENQTYTQISGSGMASGASGMTNFGSGLGALIKGHNINQNPTQEDLDKFLSALMGRYSQGGVASLANRVQEKGRGQDTMLVHMTPKEVGGLQALAMAHGGSLSINPRTGLVEAGFLSSILPMVAGAALTIGSGGVINPYMSAAIVGGVSGLASGSLSKGLMAGLGAFGGAGLGAGLSAAGATAPALTGTAPGLAQAGAVVPQAAMSAAPGSFQAALPGLGVSTASSAAAPAAATTFAPAAAPLSFGNVGTGLSNVIQGTEGARGAFMSSVGGPMGLAKYGGAAAAPILAGGFGDQSSGLPIQEQFIRPFRYGTGRQNVPYRTGERGESTAEQAYFDSRFTPVGVYKAGTEPAYGTYAMGGSIEEGVKNGDIRAFDDEYGQDEYYGGGLTALAAGGSPNKPRFLMGKGDGMSDSIPATINDTQPARLADGEFVIPADVVSHLGNGSSKAGAAKLHSMMNRIRKARTGKNRQAPEVRAERYMPA